MDALQKGRFRNIYLIYRYHVASPGAHAGAPLQRLLKSFNNDVGADRCVRPWILNVLIFFLYYTKYQVSAVES